jgi:hypothetical protein
MHSNFIFFGVIGSVLIIAMYASALNSVFADAITTCTATSKKTTTCSVTDCNMADPECKPSNWDCKLNKDGKTWSCKQHQTRTAASISPELNHALDLAVQAESHNATKVPKTDLQKGDLLKEPSLTESNNNTKFPSHLGDLNNDNNSLTVNPELQ